MSTIHHSARISALMLIVLDVMALCAPEIQPRIVSMGAAGVLTLVPIRWRWLPLVLTAMCMGIYYDSWPARAFNGEGNKATRGDPSCLVALLPNPGGVHAA
jgi:hypothetical protein